MNMLSVDRFEGKYAILIDDDENTVSVLKEALPENIKEGSIVELKNNKYIVCEEETKSRLDRIKNLQKSLWE